MKKTSSLNAIRHGLLARCVVLRTVSCENFDMLLARLIDRYCPIDDIEIRGVEEMTAAYFRPRLARPRDARQARTPKSGKRTHFCARPRDARQVPPGGHAWAPG